MARQITYGEDREVHSGDQWLITDQIDGGTKNLTVATLAKHFAQSGVADPNRLGFHYTYTDNTVPQAGQFTYDTGGRSVTQGNVESIKIHRYTNRGVDFNPVSNILGGSDLKITDVTASDNTNYSIYSSGAPQLENEIYTIPLTLRAAAGALPQGNTTVGLIGNFSNAFTGGTILDGIVDPITGEIPGQAGDVYFHINNDELDVYGPAAGVIPIGDDYSGWGTPIQLNGDQGEAVNAVRGVERPDGSGTDLTFYVDTPDPNNPTTGAIAQTVFVPQGPQGQTGPGYTNLAVNTAGDISATAENGATAFVTTNIRGPIGPLNGVASSQAVTDPAGQPAGTYLEVTFDSGDIIYIPDAEDGSHGRGINAIQVEPRGTTPTETYNVQVQYVNADGSTSAFMTVGIISDGVDGTPGTNGEGVEVEVTTSTATDYVLTFTPINADGSSGTPIVTPNLQGADGTTLLVEGGTSTPTPTNATQVTFAGTAISDVEVVGGVATVTINDDDTDQIPDATAVGQILTSTGTGEGEWEWDAAPTDTITVQDETVVIGGADTITTLNFTGGVTVTAGASGVVDIDITGGGSGGQSPELRAAGDRNREVGETFTITISADHVAGFNIVNPPTVTNGWGVTGSNPYTITALTEPSTSVFTLSGVTYTLPGDPDDYTFDDFNVNLASFFGWHYGQTSNDVDLPATSSPITVAEYFSDGGNGTLETDLPDNDQGHFNSPEDLEGNLSDGQFLYFAFPGMTEYKFYNEGRRLRNVETMVSTATDTFRYYKIQVGDDFEIIITT